VLIFQRSEQIDSYIMNCLQTWPETCNCRNDGASVLFGEIFASVHNAKR
jgi:hypothetical protein